jgi:phosphoglucosamine mutase
LHQEPYQSIINKYHASFTDGRIVIRNSGTEPVVRIMVEATTEQLARSLAQEIAHEINSIIQRAVHHQIML